jgi:hypothetical protein
MSGGCFCDYEQPEWISHTQVKAARKAHKCSECGAIIPSGSPYEYVCGKWDGCVDTFNICPLCKELRQWATISVPCFCWAYGHLHSDVREMVSETRYNVPGFFFEYGRRMVKIKRARAATAAKVAA